MMPKKKTVTLEDLIRLKRTERPSADFWAEFDREMRVKQLAAIVEPRPWWAPLIRIGARVSHYQLPMGAAAILALSFVTVREYRTTSVPSTAYAVEAEVSAALTAQPTHTTSAPAPIGATNLTMIATPALMGDQVAAEEEADAELAASATQVGYASHSVPLAETKAVPAEPTPSARYIAANLAAAQAADPSLVDDVFGSPVRSVVSREPVRDPLAQISAAGESRRARLLQSALPVGTSSNVTVGTSDRVARKLTEERLYDTISRIGVQGDRVAFKF